VAQRKLDYRFLLELLRWGLALKIPPIRVVSTRLADSVEAIQPLVPTQVVIDIPYFPLGHPRGVRFPVKAASLARFLESPEFHNEFIRWYGKQIAAALPGKGAAAKLRKSFLHLSVGRQGALPPTIILKAEYKRFVLEIKALQLDAKLPYDRKDAELLLRHGREIGAQWVRLVEKRAVSIEELVMGSPREICRLMLSAKYGCSESAIHSRLFRSSK
jgi:hypothetical protein